MQVAVLSGTRELLRLCSRCTLQEGQLASCLMSAMESRTLCPSSRASLCSTRTFDTQNPSLCGVRLTITSFCCRIERIDVAGRDVTRFLRLLLRKEGADFHRLAVFSHQECDGFSTSEFEIVREVKEKACYIAQNVLKEEEKGGDTVSVAAAD